MKAEELMIGDWVHYCGTYIQVTSLYDKGDSNEIGWGDKESTWVNGRTIGPIPLTPKTLEKNGFKLFAGVWYCQTEERRPIQICFKEDNKICTLSINCTPVPINLKYVHQLQHALKLYRIGKEIVL